jgi:outer membrane protein TolC
MRNSRLVAIVTVCAAALAPCLAQAQPRPIADVPSPMSTPTPSGAPAALSLEEAVALSLRGNRGIQSAYLQRVVERFDLTVSERAFTPKGNLAAQLIQRRVGGVTTEEAILAPSFGLRTPLGTTIGFLWERRDPLNGGLVGADEAVALTVRQPLLRGAGVAVNMAPVRIARLQEEINQLRLKATVSDTVTAVVFAYRTLLQAQEQTRLAELSLERTRALLDTNRALIDAGRMAAADIVQTESNVANQEVALFQARQQQATAQLSLLRLLGLDLRTNVVAADRIAVNRVEVDMDGALGIALDTREDVVAQRASLEQMRQALIVARNNRLWDLSVVGSVTQRDEDGRFFGGFSAPADHVIGLQLDIPIGDLSFRQQELAATTNLRVAELRYEDLEQAVEAQVRDAVQQVEILWRQVEAARRARGLAARALELQQEKLKVGRASNFEVLSFQADLRAADVQELTASIAYLNALTALDQQIGSTLDTWRISLND